MKSNGEESCRRARLEIVHWTGPKCTPWSIQVLFECRNFRCAISDSFYDFGTKSKMINVKIASQEIRDGRTLARTKLGASGHAIFGPYIQFNPGLYSIDFQIQVVRVSDNAKDDKVAVAEVMAAAERACIVSAGLTALQLLESKGQLRMTFCLEQPKTLEFRVAVTGDAELLIGASPWPVLINDLAQSESTIAPTSFPDLPPREQPKAFSENIARLRQLHERGATVRIENTDVIASVEGVEFFVKEVDDLRFVVEVFFENTYNFMVAGPVCVIDIGMNIGLATLFFARRNNVEEVHSFEPFKSTYDRAVRNINLNKSLSSKIFHNNFGLSGRDDELELLVSQNGDSGAQSTRGAQAGTPVRIALRRATSVLGPIVERARAGGKRVVAKIDCEGSEFDIFEDLVSSGLIEDFSALLVEWHRGFVERTQLDLINPLLDRGFLVFDVTPSGRRGGNGFFYAAKG